LLNLLNLSLRLWCHFWKRIIEENFYNFWYYSRGTTWFLSKLIIKSIFKQTRRLVMTKKILLEPLRETDAKWLFLESLKYIYLNHSRKSQEFVWFYWSGTSKCTWVPQGKCNLHLFTGVAQVQFLGQHKYKICQPPQWDHSWF
jgi:hypothetical protein